MSEELKYIDARQMPLDEWLALLFDVPDGAVFTSWAFPTDKHREEYIAGIGRRSEDDVCKLLEMFLIPSGTLGCDRRYMADLDVVEKEDPDMYQRMIRRQYYRRLFRYEIGFSKIPPWEGITWVLDLLPHYPRQALEGLEAYSLAHIQLLPDGRSAGLCDAIEVIRAKYIGMPGTRTEAIRFLLDLRPRHFESLVERLYHRMNYETRLTPEKKDGGRDVVASRLAPGKLERILIECKRYSEPVGVGVARALLGVVSDEKVNKGVLVTTSRFTKATQELARRNPRLELITGDQLILLMNEHLGPTWPLHIESLVTESERQISPHIASEG